ncbi:hypothetical protein U9M48_016827 [Paspalum notatum var. saurae]|uniref:KIB1-4 beta-propeller domain-containing protein n=1 Tax=Paspalum notatum var. saurae TaxID=547442 RepID=A0AAQ3WNK5_PASNO
MATFLWSPQDEDQVHLPPLQGPEAPDDGALIYSHCLLSDEPSAPGCVVLLVEDGGDGPVMWYCHPGDDQWVRHVYDIGTQTLPYPEPEGEQYEKTVICPIAACRGKFYFNSSFTDLGMLEFCPDPVFSSIPIDDSYESDDDDNDQEEYYEDNGPQPPVSVFLVESGDELYMVNLIYDDLPRMDSKISEGFVQKMDFAKRRWRDVDDLGGRTFLLSLFYFGASCAISAESGGLRQDCIYIVSLRRKEMQALNVKEDTIEVHKLDQAPAQTWPARASVLAFRAAGADHGEGASPCGSCGEVLSICAAVGLEGVDEPSVTVLTACSPVDNQPLIEAEVTVFAVEGEQPVAAGKTCTPTEELSEGKPMEFIVEDASVAVDEPHVLMLGTARSPAAGPSAGASVSTDNTEEGLVTTLTDDTEAEAFFASLQTESRGLLCSPSSARGRQT